MIWPFRARKPREDDTPPPVDATAIVRRARRLRFRVRPGAVSALSGAYHAARPGVGLSFAELRAYEPGDDVSHLDWNVTARQGRPFVRRFVEDRSLTLSLILDVSASLRFGPEGRTKADRAAQAAALLATAAVHSGDRVGLVMVSDRVETELAPAGGDRHLARLIRCLVATPSTSRRTDLGAALTRPSTRARRALVVVLSDFPTSDPTPASVWRRLALRNEVMALRFVDPRELNLPDVGLLAVADAEGGANRLVDTSRPKLRDGYAEAARGRRAAFRKLCSSTGVDGHDLSTEADPIIPLARLFRARSGGHRRGAT